MALINAHINEYGQRLGPTLPDWQARTPPSHHILQGQYCNLVPLDSGHHAEGLWRAFEQDTTGQDWTYLPYGPFANPAEFEQWLALWQEKTDPMFFCIAYAQTSQPLGLAAYLRIDPVHGTVEIGHLAFSRLLQKTPAATEAMFLMTKNVFDLGYRRLEWKCNSLNEPSRRAAMRLGFVFEGTFRQLQVVKGHSRDTDWFAMLDGEWPTHRTALVGWLHPENFDGDGRQLQSLNSVREKLRIVPLPGGGK